VQKNHCPRFIKQEFHTASVWVCAHAQYNLCDMLEHS